MITQSTPTQNKSLKLTDFIRSEAKSLGFDVVRFASAAESPDLRGRLDEFVENGYHGTMNWMEETAERRSHPNALWSDVKSIVMLGMNYGPDLDPRYLQDLTDKAAISVYARNRDYHDVIKGRLKEIATRFAARAGEQVKVFVDTAPVMEKPLSQQAGIGWQGKHTNIVSREFGSWLFLGSIFTTAELAYDQPDKDRCGSCRACIDACPTNAFPSPYKIDARRCISYLTIEHKGIIDHDLRQKIGNRVYGCDDCLAACPWNKFAAASAEIKLQAREDLKEPNISDLLRLTDGDFRAFFSGSPIKRIGRNRFIRNVLIAAGNSGNVTLIDQCKELITDTSPDVRGMAVWALSKLMSQVDFLEFAAKQEKDEDQTVVSEWLSAGA